MKRMVIVGVLFLLVAGCASSQYPDNSFEGGPGQDISVAIAGLETNEMPIDRAGSREYVIQVEVSNNSDRPVTVTRITVGPGAMGQAFQISTGYATVNEMIDPGEEHLFDVRVQGTWGRPLRVDERRVVEFRVTVYLANGESYYYTFEGPVRI